jgi:chaperonin GroEL (HSP60 family)
VLDEAERSLHDALCVLSQTVQDTRVVYGGGYPEMQVRPLASFISYKSLFLSYFSFFRVK